MSSAGPPSAPPRDEEGLSGPITIGDVTARRWHVLGAVFLALMAFGPMGALLSVGAMGAYDYAKKNPEALAGAAATAAPARARRPDVERGVRTVRDLPKEPRSA